MWERGNGEQGNKGTGNGGERGAWLLGFGSFSQRFLGGFVFSFDDDDGDDAVTLMILLLLPSRKA